jgi:hypothetical protein
VAVFVILNAVTPRMLVPPAMALAIVIAFFVTFSVSAVAAIVFHDTARCEYQQCQEQAAHCKSKHAHGVLLVVIAPIA